LEDLLRACVIDVKLQNVRKHVQNHFVSTYSLRVYRMRVYIIRAYVV